MKTLPKVYTVTLVEMPNGKFNVLNAQKYAVVNQHQARWQRTDSRNVARKVNRAGLVIK